MGATLADDWLRKLFIDPTGSFDADVVVTSYDEFVIEWARIFNDKEWSISCRFADEEEYALVFEAIWKVITDKKFTQSRSFLVVVDEVDMFSDPQHIEENLRHIIKRGRHYSISWIAICQFDTDTNKTFRGNASEYLIFVQGMLSPDMVRRVKGAANVRGESIPEVQALKKHRTAGPAIEGQHFIAVPEPFDSWRQEWRELAQQS